MNGDFDFVGVAGEGFVHRIVDDFVDEMMQSHLTGRADVHGGTFTDGFHTTQNFDGIGGVISVAVLGRNFFVFRFRVGDRGRVQSVFCGHSAPWKHAWSQALAGGTFSGAPG